MTSEWSVLAAKIINCENYYDIKIIKILDIFSEEINWMI